MTPTTKSSTSTTETTIDPPDGKPTPDGDKVEPGLLGDDNPLVKAHEVGYIGVVPDDDTDYTVAGVTSGK
jgi:hypothetical protein